MTARVVSINSNIIKVGVDHVAHIAHCFGGWEANKHGGHIVRRVILETPVDQSSAHFRDGLMLVEGLPHKLAHLGGRHFLKDAVAAQEQKLISLQIALKHGHILQIK